MSKINNQLQIYMLLCCLVALAFTSGCSVVTYKEGYKAYPQEGWMELPNKDAPYRYEYKCNKFSVYVRDGILVKGFAYWGLPIIPIPIIPISRKYDGLIFDINVKNTAITLPDEPIKIELRIPSTGQVSAPLKSLKMTFDEKIIKEWNLYNIDFWTGRTFLYKFDFINKDIKEFEIVFPSETLGCSIPKIVFKAKSKIKYVPIKVPLPS